MDPRRGTVTLADWSDRWLEQRPDLRVRTRELYRGLLRRQILPELGPVPLAKLSPSQVRAWHAQLQGPSGPGASTAAKAHRLLRAMMRTAEDDEVIVRNPCQVARAGVERAAERPVATVAEVAALADGIAPRFRAVVLLAAWCGLRRGELMGLRRSDFDLLRRTVKVERSMQQLIDGTLIFGPPETEAGRRLIAIPPHVVPEIEAHLEDFVAADPVALVFTGEHGGPLRPHVLQTAWDKARRATGQERLHVHDLRHSGNTWAAATGASTKELMARMGHANAAAALRYQHATADRDQAIARALSELAAPAAVVPIARNAFGARDRRAMSPTSERTANRGNGP
ncbi:MAG TPA: site-specific integrase [Acidimicrobiales bacterium]|nr:site-specific integrase [Acidimicrobiales bacterium]